PQDLTDEGRCQAGRQALALLKRRPPHEPPRPAEVEAVAIVCELVPELEAKAFRLFAKQMELLASAGQLDSGIWLCVSGAPAKLRLALLDRVADAGGAAALEACGIGAGAVLGACADFAVEDAASARSPRERGGPRAQAFRVLRLVASSPVEGADVGDARRGLALLRVFGRALGRAGLAALHPLLRDMQQRPCEYHWVDYVALADALAEAGGPDEPCWDVLAVALVNYWDALDRRALLRSLTGAPAALASVPEPFQRALARQCEQRSDVFQRVGAEGLAR
ncbi:unnamed protein product, partial [Prorocentrum cordatum]